MGEVIQMQCVKCGFQKKFFLGGGLRDCELETVLAALPEDGQKIFASAVRQGALGISITRKLYVCDFCGDIYALPVTNYRQNDVKQELYGVCPQCGKPGSGEGEENIHPHCPHCGTKVTMQQIGHWD